MNMFDLLRDNAMADRELLLANDAQGDVFSKARDVDFAFKCPDLQTAKDLVEFINGKSFASASVRSDQVDSTGVIWVSTVIHMPINQNVVNCVSGFMACLATLFGSEYDGWGSVIQR